MKKICRLGLFFILMFTLVMSNISFSNYVFALKDVSDSLKILSKSVYQGGNKVNDGKQIDIDQPLAVEFEVSVPVKGDRPIPAVVVEHNDTASIEIGEGLTFQGTSVKDIVIDGIKVATATFENGANNKALVKLKFDGAEKVFNGEKKNVRLKLTSTFKVDKSNALKPDGSYEIKVLGNTFKKVKPINITELKKDGQINVKDQTIEWTVKVKADGDMGGMKFADRYYQAGAYVPNSFTVNGNSKTVSVDEAQQRVEYTFEKNTTEATIKLKTKLTPEQFRASTSMKYYYNYTDILDGQDKNVLKSSYGSVGWSAKWINKSYEDLSTANGGEATWVVEFNKDERATLKDVVIEDVLTNSILTNKKQKFVSATIEKYNGTDYGTPTSITPVQTAEANGNTKLAFNLGTVDDAIRLKIKVTFDNTMSMTAANRFENTAYAIWEGITVQQRPSSQVVFTIGSGKFKKSSTSTKYVGAEMGWNFSIDKSNVTADTKIYDLIIFDKSLDSAKFNSGTLTVDQAGNSVTTEMLKKFKPQTIKYHKYIPNSFNGPAGLTADSFKVYLDGKYVADLVEVKGFNNVAETGNINFTIKSMITDPSSLIHYNNPAVDVANYGYIVQGGQVLDYASA